MSKNKYVFTIIFLGTFGLGIFTSVEIGRNQEISKIKINEFSKFADCHTDVSRDSFIQLSNVSDKDFFVKKSGREIHLCGPTSRIQSKKVKKLKNGVLLKVYLEN